MEEIIINKTSYKVFKDREQAFDSGLDCFSIKLNDCEYECFVGGIGGDSNEEGRYFSSFIYRVDDTEISKPDEGMKTEKTQGENAIDILNILLAPGNGAMYDEGIEGPTGDGLSEEVNQTVEQLKNNARKLRKLLGVDL